MIKSINFIVILSSSSSGSDRDSGIEMSSSTIDRLQRMNLNANKKLSPRGN